MKINYEILTTMAPNIIFAAVKLVPVEVKKGNRKKKKVS